MWQLIAVVVLALLVVLAATAVGSAFALLTRRWWMGRAGGGALAVVLGIGLASFAAFIVGWLAPATLIAFDVAVVLTSVVVIVILVRRRPVVIPWRRAVELLLLVVGLLFLYLGIVFLWEPSSTLFDLAAGRFDRTPLPVDNRIPYLFSERLAQGASTHGLVAEWNGSDRPPLLSGFILLIRGWTDLVGIGPVLSGFAASVGGQLLWVPALYAFVRACGGSPSVARLAVIACGVTGTTLVNTVYTWPKSMSAAFVLLAAACLVHALRRPATFRWLVPVAVTAFVLGMLAHGAAAFAAPFLLIVGVMACRRQRFSSLLRGGGIGVALGVAFYLPWLAYQRLVDPPGDRLLKWHLAGVIPIDDRSFLEAIAETYRDLTFTEWIFGRLENFRTMFNSNPLAGMFDGPEARRNHEFFETTGALGIAYVVLVLVLILVVVGRIRDRSSSWSDRRFVLLVGASIACILFWALVMVQPGSTVVHQGSQFWLLVLISSPVLWLGRRGRSLYVVGQGLLMLVWYLPPPASAPLLPFSAIVGLAGVGALLLAARGLPVRSRRLLLTRKATS